MEAERWVKILGRVPDIRYGQDQGCGVRGREQIPGVSFAEMDLVSAGGKAGCPSSPPVEVSSAIS